MSGEGKPWLEHWKKKRSASSLRFYDLEEICRKTIFLNANIIFRMEND